LPTVLPARGAKCPVEAIFAGDDMPADQQEYIELNARLSALWPSITSRKDPLPDADQYSKVKDKRKLLIE